MVYCVSMVQVDLKKVVEHVCDTAGHLLKPNVTLEKMVDQSTPLIAGDGSRIVQVCPPPTRPCPPASCAARPDAVSAAAVKHQMLDAMLPLLLH